MGNSNTQYETRTIDLVELRTLPDKPNTLVGRAVPYGVLSKDLGKFRERIQPGSLTRTLSDGHDIRALLNHNSEQLLGRTSNKTLRLSEDANGLTAEIELPDTSYARDAIALLKRGDIGGNGKGAMSFAFRVPRGGDRFHRDGNETIRTISDMDLGEVSLLMADPAYDSTPVSLRVAPDAIAQAQALTETPKLSERRAALRRLKLAPNR